MKSSTFNVFFKSKYYVFKLAPMPRDICILYVDRLFPELLDAE